MKICGNVIDKCCTIADEIKISKMWNSRIAPMLDAHNDEYIGYLKNILIKFEDLMQVDPRMIVLKYVSYINVPL